MLQPRQVISLIFLFISTFLYADCPALQTTLDTEDIPAIRSILDQLKNCEAPADSLAVANYELAKLYYYNDQLDTAIIFAKQALKIRENLYQDIPNVDLGYAYNLLGVLYRENGQNELAKSYLEDAINVRVEIKHDRVTQSYLALANIYSEQGDFVNAVNYYTLMLEVARKEKDQKSIVSALYTLGNTYIEQENYPLAKQALNEALNLLNTQDKSIEKANIFLNLANAHYHLGQYPTAKSQYKAAIKIYQKLKDCDYTALALNGLGRTLHKLDEESQAFKTLGSAIQNSKNCEYNDYIAMSYDNLGEYHLDKNVPQKALHNFQQAIKSLVPLFKPKDDFENPKVTDFNNVYYKVDLLVYLSDKARALKMLAEQDENSDLLTNALTLYKLGDQLIDQLRQEHSSEDTKLFWRKKVLPFYEKAIAVCEETQDVENAFFFFEKSKAILLLEALQDADATDVLSDEEQSEIKNLKQSLINARAELDYAGEAELAEKLQTLLGIQKQFDDQTQQLAAKYPKYNTLKYGSEIIGLEQFQKEELKKNGQVSVHYFYGEENVYALRTSPENSRLIILGAPEPIITDIRKFLTFFEQASAIENAPDDFLKQSFQLYQRLIAPLDLKKTGELLVFPYGALAYLPFEALTSAKSDNLATANYLLKDFTIRYAYSAAILHQQHSLNNLTNPLVLAFAPFANSTGKTELADLDFSNDELAKIQKQVKGIYLIDEEATLQNFLKLKNENAVIHLSTHAFSSATEDQPRIEFSDTALYLRQLYAMDLPSELVVLSACQTNIGQLSSGEGVLSLGRGFTHAGAKSLIASLWNVNASSTGQVIADFYQNLQSNLPKYQALHQAKLNYLNDPGIASYERSPYYWAGMIYYGDNENLVLEKKSNYWILFALLVLLILGFFFGWRSK